MFNAYRGIVILMAISGIVACGQSGEQADSPAPPPVQDTAFGDMVGAMDKARGVEATTMQHKADMDRALQEQEGAGAETR